MSNIINFTNSEGLVRSFNDLELDRILTDLNASNSYFTSSYNDLIFIRLSDGYLLLYDKKNQIATDDYLKCFLSDLLQIIHIV